MTQQIPCSEEILVGTALPALRRQLSHLLRAPSAVLPSRRRAAAATVLADPQLLHLALEAVAALARSRRGARGDVVSLAEGDPLAGASARELALQHHHLAPEAVVLLLQVLDEDVLLVLALDLVVVRRGPRDDDLDPEAALEHLDLAVPVLFAALDLDLHPGFPSRELDRQALLELGYAVLADGLLELQHAVLHGQKVGFGRHSRLVLAVQGVSQIVNLFG